MRMDSFCPKRSLSLEFICLQYIKDVLADATAESLQSTDIKVLVDGIHTLPDPFVKLIFDYLGKSGSFSSDFKLELFQKRKRVSLETLYLYNITESITNSSLLGFSTYKLKEIVLKFKRNIMWHPSIDDLWQAFQGSEHTLQTLKLISYPLTLCNGIHTFDLATRFPNLQSLSIHSFAENCFLDDKQWAKLFYCPSLKFLEIFTPNNTTRTFLDTALLANSPARKLNSLCLPTVLNNKGVIDPTCGLEGLCFMDSLTHLDISIDDELDSDGIHILLAREKRENTSEGFMKELEDSNVLPNLRSLDLSGWRRVNALQIEKLLKSHKHIAFLGLCLLDITYTKDDDFVEKSKSIQISGIFLLNQIFVSLRIYPNRSLYLREALKSLFVLCGVWVERKPDVIQLVLRTLREHSNDHLLQLAATACLYNLTKNDPKLEPVHPSQLVEAADLSLQALKRFLSIEKRQIMKNCLLIFCNDKLLHFPQFKRYEVSRVCLDCMLMVPESSDRQITRMAVAVVSVLACKITSHETSLLTGKAEMELLLKIAKERLGGEIDGTLKFDLSALWNLTDESPKACYLFVHNGGLDLYIELLRNFPEEHSIQTKVLGLLNNIAEVPELHELMITDDLMQYVGKLVESTEKSVSYFAGGIIANLAYGWNTKHILQVTSKHELLDKLENAVERWGTLESEIVTYRSFKPFLGLLDSFHLAAVQHFSLWAIHHVCTLNSERYKELMTPECIEKLVRLKLSPFTKTARQREMVDEIFVACGIKLGEVFPNSTKI